ncbi:MAG: hypothetical protein JO089_09620, partial [Alphaproteobacteria bacterium]|nr:hypothetical protein [Alphaproteobacteria bacterium]
MANEYTVRAIPFSGSINVLTIIVKPMRADCKPIVDLLTGLYVEIRDLETEYGLRLGEGDFRPRIEYFHD